MYTAQLRVGKQTDTGRPPDPGTTWPKRVNIAHGALEVTSGDLNRLIGHPTTGMPEAVRAAA